VSMTKCPTAVLIMGRYHGVTRTSAHTHRQRHACTAFGIAERRVFQPLVKPAVRVLIIPNITNNFIFVPDRLPALVQLTLAPDHQLIRPNGGARCMDWHTQPRRRKSVAPRQLPKLQFRERELFVSKAAWLGLVALRGSPWII